MISPSTSVNIDDDLKQAIKDTKSYRETGYYFTRLLEWGRLPWYKRIFTKKPTLEETTKDLYKPAALTERD